MASDNQKGSAADVVNVPATPPRDAPTRQGVRSPGQQAQLRKTPTPPPSSQVPTDTHTVAHPLTPTTGRRNASKDLPSTQRIESASVEELRSMVKHLVSDLTDARITAANARLQHHFLLLETSQAAERAEVENQLSRTQVDFLRGKQRGACVNAPAVTSSAVQPPTTIRDATAQNMRDLERHCEALEELCDKLKRETERQAERIQSLSEHNSLLVNRIRENRQHFTRIRERSPIMYTPREVYTTPRRKNYSRYQEDTPAHGPFAALIAADQILSQETASVPSTPTRKGVPRFKSGHSRGAHSLSSINTPQNIDRPSTSDGFLGSQLLLSAPASQTANESAERERHDRDSTISVSDDGNNGQSGLLTQSQASSLATDMLRKNPGSFESFRGSQDAEKSSNLLQSKIFGNVRKPNHDGHSAKLKRQYGFTDSPSKSKKIRTEDKVGLGIEA